MVARSIRLAVLGLVTLLGAASAVPEASAQDFFSNLFGGFGVRPPAPPIERPLFYAPPMEAPREHIARSGGQAYCVRSCDGRYFPIAATGGESRAETCNSFCPASKTEVVYGSSIDDAATAKGKAYSELPNAFRYRKELVAGCTCNGKDPTGLARIKIEDDPTLQRGDIVAGADGLLVAGRDRRSASLNLSPLPDAMRARLKHVPVVARE
jgi:hypothetical protein